MTLPHTANLTLDPARASVRWGVYWLLIMIASGNMVGRILAVNSVDQAGIEKNRVAQEVAAAKKRLAADGPVDEAALEARIRAEIAAKRIQRPFLSANDRSRWCTVRSLVELDPPTYAIEEILSEPGWDTIDMVAHERDGEMHLYSSKPPLFSTLVAGLYWPIYHLSGSGTEDSPRTTLGTHPYEIGRALLIVVNVLPLLIYFVLLARLAERYGATDWGRIFMVACGTLGTFLNTFAVVLNNHIPAAVCALIAIYASLRIWYDGERRLRYFFVAGFFAAFTVVDDLPALSMLAMLSAGLLWKAPKQTLLVYTPAVLLVTAAYFGTTYLAHGSWMPAYAYRHAHTTPDENGRSRANPPDADDSKPAKDNWYDYEYFKRRDGKVFPGVTRANPQGIDLSTGRIIESYWRSPKGIDRGERNRGLYAFHSLIGHHGIFSLTPVWLLSIVGVGMLAFGRGQRMQAFALLVATLTIVCILFYLMRPTADRNYGGMTSAFRWVFWFAPLWLTAMLPASDWLGARRWGRIVAGLLLMFSVLAASYPTWNPWTYPWLMSLHVHLGGS